MFRSQQWLLILCGVLLSSMNAMAATPLLQYQFNTAGDVQTSTGSDAVSLTTYNGTGTEDFVGGSATGPSGNKGDLSLDLNTSTSPNNYAATTSSADNPMLDNLGGCTITAWVSNVVATTHPEYILDLGSSGNGVAFGLNGSTSANSAMVKVGGGPPQTAPFSISSVSTTWKFIAVTFDYKSESIYFYQGSSIAGSSITTSLPISDTRDSIGSPNTFVGIGNVNPGSSYQLVGNLDDVQFFGTALTATNIESLRDQDLPESGCLPAAATCLLLMARWRALRPRRSTSTSIIPEA